MFVSSRRGWSLLVIPLALLAYVRHGIAGNDQEVTYLPPDEDSPDDGQCVAAAENNAPGDLPVGDSRPFGPDVVRVPAHMTSAELTSATWGVIPEQYLDSWLLYDGGNFLWKRSRTAPAGDELDAGAVSWTGLDDGGQELPRARGSGSAVAMYTYTIKSSTERTKKVKRFAEASVAAEAGAQWAGGSANTKVNASVDTESDFDHSISEKVNITISIKCASYLVAGNQNPEAAILYYGPDSVMRDLPLPIKDADGRPKTIKWNPIAVDADYSAENAATNGDTVACWFKYRGAIDKGEVSNANWSTKRGLAAEIGVSNGWRLWKFTADIRVQGKAAGEWNDMDKTEFTKDATGTWALSGNNYWSFPAPLTEKQRDDFQKPCKDNRDAVACAQWDNIKAAYMSAIMKIRGVDGATENGPNYRMAEWQGAMLSGSFRKVGDWLDSSTLFQLAELQQVGQDCNVEGYAIRVFPGIIPDNLFRYSGAIYGLKADRCSVVDVAKQLDTTTKVGKLEQAVLDRGNTTRFNLRWLKKSGYKCGHKDWDWGVRVPYPWWYFGHRIARAQSTQPKDLLFSNAPEYVCWGCRSVNGTSCNN